MQRCLIGMPDERPAKAKAAAEKKAKAAKDAAAKEQKKKALSAQQQKMKYCAGKWQDEKRPRTSWAATPFARPCAAA